ncbi:hypothetical protein R69927_00435 [Paraburkholderia domus]|nr:hypothetical protein R69927_00435 [Paraburkholderia domus]
MGSGFGSRGQSRSRHLSPKGRWMRLDVVRNKKPREPFGCGVLGQARTTLDVILVERRRNHPTPTNPHKNQSLTLSVYTLAYHPLCTCQRFLQRVAKWNDSLRGHRPQLRIPPMLMFACRSAASSSVSHGRTGRRPLSRSQDCLSCQRARMSLDLLFKSNGLPKYCVRRSSGAAETTRIARCIIRLFNRTGEIKGLL